MGAFKNFLVASSIAGLALAHPHNNNKRLALGTIYNSCTTPGVVALTFDDGPYIYTQEIVNTFVGTGHQVSFFQNGLSSLSRKRYKS
jgi:peptidoglycan/xylan/chitin deacetylase (PgdA/CDA1 family)